MTTRFIPLDKLDKSIHYVIVGVQKSGTSSLYDLMLSMGFIVEKSEFSFLRVEDAENFDYTNFTPIIIVRNPLERAWSDHNYFKNTSFPDSCDASFYKAGLQMWDSLIYSLEYLKSLPNFPHIRSNNKKKKLTNNIKKKILTELYNGVV